MSKNPRCLFNSDFVSFLNSDNNAILGELCDNFHGSALTTTIEAWKSEIEIMKNIVTSLQDNKGQIIFEYDIPRLGKRIDVVLLLHGIVFALEFKVGADEYLRQDTEQVWDYALDLKNFHEGSHNKVIVPILVATEALETSLQFSACIYNDKVYEPVCTNAKDLRSCIKKILEIEKKKNNLLVQIVEHH